MDVASLLVGSLLAIVGAVVSAYVWENKIRDRITVRRIVSRKDEDAEGVLDLYDYWFDQDGTNYTHEEVLDMMDDSSDFSVERHTKAENIVLIAKFRKSVAGFLFCHFYPRKNKAIISYYAINENILEAKNEAAARIIASLKEILLNADHFCEFLFFDLQKVDACGSKEDSRRKIGRPRLFRASAAKIGLTAFELQFPYLGPKISLSEGAQEPALLLMCVPVGAFLPKPVPRDMLLDFLRFIHHDCYGDLYPTTDERFTPYHNYLDARVRNYENTLPPTIEAK